jgi:hypothetical protein
MLSDERLAEIRARTEAKTPGEWDATPWNTLPNGYLHGPAPCHEHGRLPPGLVKTDIPVSFRWEDCDFIAHAGTDIADLLAEIYRLRSLLEGEDAE